MAVKLTNLKYLITFKLLSDLALGAARLLQAILHIAMVHSRKKLPGCAAVIYIFERAIVRTEPQRKRT
jgi:hypothetical protein